MTAAAKELPEYMKEFSVDLFALQEKYCGDRSPFVIPGRTGDRAYFFGALSCSAQNQTGLFPDQGAGAAAVSGCAGTGRTAQKNARNFYKSQVEKVKADPGAPDTGSDQKIHLRRAFCAV